MTYDSFRILLAVGCAFDWETRYCFAAVTRYFFGRYMVFFFAAVKWFFFLRPLHDSILCGRYGKFFYVPPLQDYHFAAVTRYCFCRRYKKLLFPTLRGIFFAAVTILAAVARSYFCGCYTIIFLPPLQDLFFSLLEGILFAAVTRYILFAAVTRY